MVDLEIQELRYDKKEVGKKFSSSKILYTWEFKLNNISHRIELYDHRLSDKKKITLDGKVLFYDKDDSEFFSYKFTLRGNKFELYKTNEYIYDIKIKGKKFQTIDGGKKEFEIRKNKK